MDEYHSPIAKLVQMAFAVYEEFKLVETANVKLSNFTAAKKFILVVKQ